MAVRVAVRVAVRDGGRVRPRRRTAARRLDATAVVMLQVVLVLLASRLYC